MPNRHRTALILGGAAVLASLLVLISQIDPALPAQGCHARLTALDHARFEQTEDSVRFDGTLLFHTSSLHVEGMLTMGNATFRLHRQVIWTKNWLEPALRTQLTNRIYFGDTLPVNVATQLPLLGESAVELRFMPLDTRHFAVFANGVFFTYCRRV
jgi:hypothetical protein